MLLDYERKCLLYLNKNNFLTHTKMYNIIKKNFIVTFLCVIEFSLSGNKTKLI